MQYGTKMLQLETWLTNCACDLQILGRLFHGRVAFGMNRQKDCKNRTEIRVLIVRLIKW